MTIEIGRGPLSRSAHALFGAGSRLRGRRIFHPDGTGFAGTLWIEQTLPGHETVPLLQAGEERAVYARLARAIGLPEPMPDLLGFSLRIEDGFGAGEDMDLGLISSADGIGHFLLLPTLSGFLERPYSSVMLYEIAGAKRLFGVLPRTAPTVSRSERAIDQLLSTFGGQGDLRFSLAVAPPRGTFCPFGEIVLDRQLPAEESEAICFNPARSGAGIRAAGPLMGVRGAAYVGSQRARGALSEDEEIKRDPHPEGAG